jgi:hypothetical protein
MSHRRGEYGRLPGVDQIDVSTMLLEFLLKEIRVLGGVESQESRTKASGKGCLWLSDTSFSSSHLGSVTGQEVIHRLSRGKLGDGREDTVRIAGEEEDGVGMVAKGLRLVVGNVVDGVGDTAILSLLSVEVIHFLGDRIDHNILEKSIALDGTVDIWLRLLGEVDGLGVASSFKVENSLVVPSMLIVTDELATEKCEDGKRERKVAYCGSAERVVLPVPERPK